MVNCELAHKGSHLEVTRGPFCIRPWQVTWPRLASGLWGCHPPKEKRNV